MKIEEVTTAMERDQAVLHTHMGIAVWCRITGCISRYSREKGWHYALELAELKSKGRGFVMTAKEYLSQYRDLCLKISTKLEECEQIRALAEKITPSSERGESVGIISDRVGHGAAKLVDLEREIDVEIDRLVDLRKEIEAAIAKVGDERYRVILKERYINGKKWAKIAEHLNIEIRWVFRMHKRALSKIKIDH